MGCEDTRAGELVAASVGREIGARAVSRQPVTLGLQVCAHGFRAWALPAELEALLLACRWRAKVVP
jgi:hypothetical protein